MYGAIEVRGARENNLKGISLDIPKRQLTVFSGVSGSGKSSLVFGSIAAESQRLLNETYTASCSRSSVRRRAISDARRLTCRKCRATSASGAVRGGP